MQTLGIAAAVRTRGRGGFHFAHANACRSLIAIRIADRLLACLYLHTEQYLPAAPRDGEGAAKIPQFFLKNHHKSA
jgi:hypothetical protein